MKQKSPADDLQPRPLDRLVSLVRARRRGGRRARAIRRVLAIALLLAAGALALAAPEHAQPGVVAIVVTRDVAAGAVLTSDDLRLQTVSWAPSGILTDQATARGRTLSAAMRGGEILTDARVVPVDGLQPGPGRVAVPLRLADPASTALLRPGMHVALLIVDKAGSPRRLTADAIVLAVPTITAVGAAEPKVGVVAGGTAPLAIVAVPEPDADQVAVAALAGDIAIRFT